jgi:hypothetical protein
MPFTHASRRGKTYYLHVGKTKTGKDKHFCSTKSDGTLLDAVPEGFEVYENPDGLVYLRRKTRTLLTPEELGCVEEAVKRETSLKDYEFKIEHDQDTITVFTINDDPKAMLEALNPFRARHEHFVREFALRSGTFTAMMRFRLVNSQKRLFDAERFCFRGSVDNWIPISRSEKLPALAKRFVTHLDKESFYDLMWP